MFYVTEERGRALRPARPRSLLNPFLPLRSHTLPAKKKPQPTPTDTSPVSIAVEFAGKLYPAILVQRTLGTVVGSVSRSARVVLTCPRKQSAEATHWARMLSEWGYRYVTINLERKCAPST